MKLKHVVTASVLGGVLVAATTSAFAIRFEPEKGYFMQVRHVCVIEHSNEGSVHIGSSTKLEYARLNARTRCQYTTHSDGCTHNNMSCEEREVWVKRRW